MYKIIVAIIIFLINYFNVFADTTLNYSDTLPVFDECPSEPGIDSGAGPRTKYGVPLSNSIGGSANGSITCDTHYYYSSSDQTVSFVLDNGGLTSCGVGKRYVTGSLSCTGVNCTMTCRDYDDTTPTISDIIGTTPNDFSDLLATNSQNFQINVSDNFGSPITSIIIFFEDYSTPNSYKTIGDECVSGCNQNIQNVDNAININGGRYYSLRISKICDEAGNCIGTGSVLSDLMTGTFNVYSDYTNFVGDVILNELDDIGNIADGSDKNLTIKLNDIYGNRIIPSTGVGRTIDFIFNTDNDLHLNQYSLTGNGVYLNSTTDTSNYINRIGTGVGINNYLNSQFSNDGEYNYKFKVYSPTQNVYDKAYGNLDFNMIRTNVTDSIIPSGFIFNINNSVFSSRFLPIYKTTFSGGIVDDGMSEGSIQSSNIEITKNGTAITPTAKKLFIEFGSGDTNDVNSQLDLKYGIIPSLVNNDVGEGFTNSTLFKSDYLAPITYPIFTKLLMGTGGLLDDIQNSYISTHIGYSLDGKDIVYNSDIYGKDNYWGTIGTGNTYASVVKVVGKTYSKNFNEIISGQATNEVSLLNGSITKSSLKTEVRRNAYNIIRNVTITNTGNTINDSNFMNNFDGEKLLSGSMIYFGGLKGQNVTLNTLTAFEGNKTILIEGGNLYIEGNVDVLGDKSLLSIVVLKDIYGSGGNVYINPNVSYIKSVIYADKALISYDGTNELDGNTGFSILKNQLYIYGSVFTENTVGGSRSDPLMCPYYVNACIDREVVQKYDLNYLRRYYLKDTNSDGIGDTPAGGGDAYFSFGDLNYKYPLVIEYNPLIQTNPPLIFKK